MTVKGLKIGSGLNIKAKKKKLKKIFNLKLATHWFNWHPKYDHIIVEKKMSA